MADVRGNDDIIERLVAIGEQTAAGKRTRKTDKTEPTGCSWCSEDVDRYGLGRHLDWIGVARLLLLLMRVLLAARAHRRRHSPPREHQRLFHSRASSSTAVLTITAAKTPLLCKESYKLSPVAPSAHLPAGLGPGELI